MLNKRPYLSLPLALLLIACGGTVTNGGGSGGNGSSGGNGGNGSGGNDMLFPAVANTRAELDVLWDQYWQQNGGASGGTTSSSGGEPLDPNDLFVRISDVGVSCNSPTVELPCGEHWSLTLGIPSAIQQVGVYDLQNSPVSLYSSMSETGEPYSSTPGDCGFGGGSLGPGSLEILSISAQEVHLKLSMQPTGFVVDPSGDYIVPRCP